MASKVVSLEQLSQVAQAQKGYIDGKDSKVREDLGKAIDEAVGNIVLPETATEEEVKAILDLYATEEGTEPTE